MKLYLFFLGGLVVIFLIVMAIASAVLRIQTSLRARKAKAAEERGDFGSAIALYKTIVLSLACGELSLACGEAQWRTWLLKLESTYEKSGTKIDTASVSDAYQDIGKIQASGMSDKEKKRLLGKAVATLKEAVNALP